MSSFISSLAHKAIKVAKSVLEKLGIIEDILDIALSLSEALKKYRKHPMA